MEQKRRLIPPVYFFFALAVMAALHWVLPIARVIPPPVSYLGVLFMVAGLWLLGHAFRGFT
jgi:hypothetical protein